MIKKLFLLAVLLLSCSMTAWAQQPLPINLSIGLNSVEFNRAPNTSAAFYQLNFPANATSFSVIGQPHTLSLPTNGVSIGLVAANNTALTPFAVAGNGGLYTLNCIMGNFGGTPQNITLMTPTTITLVNTTTGLANSSSCSVPQSMGAILSTLGAGNGGPTYDIFVVVFNTPLQTTSLGIPFRTDASGVIPLVDFILSNSGINIQPSAPIDGGGAQRLLATDSFLFNGSTYDAPVKCPTAVAISIAAAGTQQIVAPAASKLVRVCAMYLTISTGGTLSFTEGTGATCGTGTTTIFGQSTFAVGNTSIFSSGTSVLQTNTLGDGLCLVSGTAAVQGWAQVEQH